MDAATRAELDALRVRAYGPSADLAADPAALARLDELESLALSDRRRERAARQSRDAPPAEAPDAEPTQAETSALSAGTSALSAGGPPRRHAPRWAIGAVAAAVGVAVLLGVASALQPSTTSGPANTSGPAATPGTTTAGPTVAPADAADEIPAEVRDAIAFASAPQARTLITVNVDGSFGNYVDIPANGEAPHFPIVPMTWVQPLGDYYGWELWIGGARSEPENLNCLLLASDSQTRVDCVSIDLKAQGAMLVAVPFADIPESERPEGMTIGQSLGFWWGGDGVVTILLGTTTG